MPFRAAVPASRSTAPGTGHTCSRKRSTGCTPYQSRSQPPQPTPVDQDRGGGKIDNSNQDRYCDRPERAVLVRPDVRKHQRAVLMRFQAGRLAIPMNFEDPLVEVAQRLPGNGAVALGLELAAAAAGPPPSWF